MAFGDSIGLLFTLKAKDEASRVVSSATGNIKGDVKELDTTVGKLAQSFGFSTSQASALSKALPVVGAAAGILSATALAAGTAVFNLTKRASDAGSEIYEAGQKTNLTTEFLSVLKVQAEQSGSSFGTATAQVTKWSNSLVDAARGNADLTAHLKRFGIDAAEAYRNPEAALKQFIERFNQLPPSAANNEAAMKLFKDRTGEIIPVLRSFGGDYDSLVQKLDASGQIWTKEATEKADEFGDALTELGQVASGVANTFAREVMPDITGAMKEISKAFAENKDTVRAWGRGTGDVIRGVLEVLKSDGSGILSWLGRIALEMNLVTGGILRLRDIGAASRGTTEPGAGDPGRRFGGHANAPPPGGITPPTPPAPDDVTNEAVAKERQRKLEAARRAELRAAEQAEQDRLDMMRRFNSMVGDLIEGNRQLEAKAIKEGEELDRKAAEERIDAAEAVQKAIRDSLAVVTEENTRLREMEDLIRKAEIIGAIDARTAALARQLVVLTEMRDKVMDIGAPVGDVKPIPQGAGPWVDPSTLQPPPPNPWVDFGTVVADVANRIGEVVGVAGATVAGVMGNIGAALHQTVQAFGGLGGALKNLGEFFRAVVKNIRDMAVVNAIWEAAQAAAAWALSFFWPGMAKKAVLHMKAAALYGVVAGAAGVAAAAMGSGGGAAVAGSTLGGSPQAGGGGIGIDQREDYRTRYLREQAEKDRYTSRETRREDIRLEFPVNLDGREIARGVVRIVRDGGSERDDLKNALGVAG